MLLKIYIYIFKVDYFIFFVLAVYQLDVNVLQIFIITFLNT